MIEKPNYTTTSRCDLCKRIVDKEVVVLGKTAYGIKTYTCKNCAILNDISIENVGEGY